MRRSDAPRPRPIRAFQAIDPGGPRLRALANDVIDNEAWRMLWIPPVLPYHQLAGPYARPEVKGFTKRLVFSAWNAVPRSVAGLLSYLADRRLTLGADPAAEHPRAAGKPAQPARLRDGPHERRLTGMPALALIYPSPRSRLSPTRATSPRASRTGRSGHAHVGPGANRAIARDALPAAAPADLDGDARWYWAAPLLLDASRPQVVGRR